MNFFDVLLLWKYFKDGDIVVFFDFLVYKIIIKGICMNLYNVCFKS